MSTRLSENHNLLTDYAINLLASKR